MDNAIIESAIGEVGQNERKTNLDNNATRHVCKPWKKKRQKLVKKGILELTQTVLIKLHFWMFQSTSADIFIAIHFFQIHEY